SVMAGHQLPLLSLFVPVYMIRCMCGWRQTFEVWPALLVAGLSFAAFQFTFATLHYYVPGAVPLYPMTDIGGGIFSLVLTALFLKFWKPRNVWRLDAVATSSAQKESMPHGGCQPSSMSLEPKLTAASIALAWAPYA